MVHQDADGATLGLGYSAIGNGVDRQNYLIRSKQWSQGIVSFLSVLGVPVLMVFPNVASSAQTRSVQAQGDLIKPSPIQEPNSSSSGPIHDNPT